jgi:hypothetical protein
MVPKSRKAEHCLDVHISASCFKSLDPLGLRTERIAEHQLTETSVETEKKLSKLANDHVRLYLEDHPTCLKSVSPGVS